jgi:hypothetical protein
MMEHWPVPLPRATKIVPKRYAPARAVRERSGMEGKPRSHNWLQRRLRDPSFPKPALKIAGRYFWDVDDLEVHEMAQREKIAGLIIETRQRLKRDGGQA